MTNHPFLHVASRAAFALYALSAGYTAHADVLFTVNTTADLIDDNLGDGLCHTSTNTCSLRAALMQANHLTGTGLTVVLLPAGIFLLSRTPQGANGEDSGDLYLAAPVVAGQSVSIFGTGATHTIVDANHIDRVLAIETGRTVHLSGITLRNGTRTSTSTGTGNGTGGGIFNRGDLAISDSVIEGNTSVEGGGIESSGALLIERSTVRSNRAQYGGGMYVYGNTQINASTLYSNAASPGSGGAIFNANELRVTSSTLSQNAADTDGGAIFSNYQASVFSSSIINNDADHDRDENGGDGGGVYFAQFTASAFNILNTLFADNTVLDAPIYNDCAGTGTIQAFGWNLFGDASGCTIVGPWGLVTPATIGPLGDNGGPTWTHALLAGSEAIDSPSGGSGCVDGEGEDIQTDQRGAARVTGSRCDIGAFEFGSVLDRIFRSGFD
ncbi:MAG: choice-of-anchor Q domain-containing protein [Dokdonella sp.]